MFVVIVFSFSFNFALCVEGFFSGFFFRSFSTSRCLCLFSQVLNCRTLLCVFKFLEIFSFNVGRLFSIFKFFNFFCNFVSFFLQVRYFQLCE